ERKIVQLTSHDKAVRILAVTGKQVLKLIKVSGGMMPSLVRYDFTLTDTKPTYDGVVRMQGMYSRKRGRGIFQECLSGVSFPLLNKGRTAEAEQAYQDIMHGRAESLFVTLDVRLSSRIGRGDRLIPVRSVHIDPYRSCSGKDRRVATIADNRWYLLEVGGKTLEPESLSKPPFLKVQSGDQLIQGFAGCNNFTGSWLFIDNEFVFSRIAATRMACPVGMELEEDFFQAIDSARKYTIRDDILSLHDRRGKVLARLRHSRQLTDLDFILSPEQVEIGEDIFPDEFEIPESHSVEVEGAVPASIAVPLVDVREKKIRRKSPNIRKNYTSGHKITVLKAKKKVAVRATARTDRRAVVKEVVPSSKSSVPPAVNKRQEEKANAPSPSPSLSPSVPEKRETITEQATEKKASVDNTEQARPQNNNTEEIAPSKAPVSTAIENNGQQIQSEPEVIENGDNVISSETGEKLSPDETVAQPVIQSGEEKDS
ncbi:MAG: META domain-containing protein, partial [Candidatus Electrothrix sp. GM3_4]|nr:META domain-containing protein [Candidatus Electrothrix sp. GM3_4]